MLLAGEQNVQNPRDMVPKTLIRILVKTLGLDNRRKFCVRTQERIFFVLWVFGSVFLWDYLLNFFFFFAALLTTLKRVRLVYPAATLEPK